MIRRFVSLIVSAVFATTVSAQMLSVNTDLAMAALQTPSFGMELVVGNHTSISLNGLGNYNPWGSNVRILAFQPELRYYLSRRPMYHHFVGVCGLAASYDMLYDGVRRDGYGIGGGITFGYVVPLSSRWNIDFHAGFTTFFYEQREFEPDKFANETVDKILPLNTNGHYTLPARIGVSLTYIIN